MDNGHAAIDNEFSESSGVAERRSLQQAVAAAESALLAQQREDGHWVYPLEADCTIPAEYILMNHFVDTVDDETERALADYLRARQIDHGGWPLFHGGDFNLSCSVKSYYALKMVGDDPRDEHMTRARGAILQHGGAARANVFTRLLMAMFEQVPWRATPFIPPEIVFLPRWFPFHIDKVSYWSRTVMVPLFILCSLRARAVNPRAVDIRELFVTPPEDEDNYFRVTTPLGRVFLVLDRIGRVLEKLVPKAVNQAAVEQCERWCIDRMNGEHGIGGIFPAMVNVYEALVVLGHDRDSALVKQARTAIDRLLCRDEATDLRYCQPCVSPVWDTSLACQALLACDKSRDARPTDNRALARALTWLRERQLDAEPGDWRRFDAALPGGGWAFQYSNYYYPDLDDTSMVAWAMIESDDDAHRDAVARAAEWVRGMQSKGGGFGSFEVNNTQYYLNAIPFADHGALLDPPTADVTGRCVALLALADREKYRATIDAAVDYLKREQESDGSWFGRWGTNYIYGVWSVLTALEVAGEDPQQAWVRRAVEWLKETQNRDGGWGESNDSYYPPRHHRPHASTSFQTAWALLALLAVGERDADSARRGVEYLLDKQRDDGFWCDADFTAPGFPRVFYLKYHGYTRYFPLWALARYHALR